MPSSTDIFTFREVTCFYLLRTQKLQNILKPLANIAEDVCQVYLLINLAPETVICFKNTQKSFSISPHIIFDYKISLCFLIFR